MIGGRFIAAWRGRALWLGLRERHEIDNGAYVVAFIEDDPALNQVALARITDLIADRQARGVVVVTDQARVAEQIREDSDGILAVEVFTQRQIDALLSYYEMCQFSVRIFFVSLTRPYSNHLWRMAGIDRLTLDDLVCLAMYRIRGWAGGEVARA
ncbi:MAG TPA: hypothetical protein VMF07_14725 [Solirubrobacteraceae bacterium]|nr:hypothetical protein [Solirubrobacteraceae bacterium]